MKLTLILFTAFLLTTNGIAGNTVYVKTDGVPFTSIGNHASWATATSELQTAIDSLHAAGGGEVWVAAGTYYPTLTDDRNISFYPRNNVVVYGGFAGTETTVEERLLSDIDTSGTVEPWEFTNPTIFSGEMNDPYHIVNGEGTDSTAILDGFTIKSRYIPNLWRFEAEKGTDYIHEDTEKDITPYNLLTEKSKVDYIFESRFNELFSEIRVTDHPAGKRFLKDDLSFPDAENLHTIQKIDSVKFMNLDSNEELITERILEDSHGGGACQACLQNCMISNIEALSGSIIDSCQLEHCCLQYNKVIKSTVENSVLDHCVIKLNECVTFGVGAVNSVLTDCILTDNFALNGTLCTGSTLHNCIISENYMDDGPVLISCILVNCNVLNNTTMGYILLSGGYVMNSKFINNLSRNRLIVSSYISNTEFISNICDGEFLTNTTSSNCILANNNCRILTTNSFLCNCTITGNTFSYLSYDPTDEDHNSSFYNCTIWKNDIPNPIASNSSIFFCAVDGSTEGEGNIVLDSLNATGPQFINPSTIIGHPTNPEELEQVLNADWSLQHTSPCIDKGSIEYYVLVPGTDAKGNPRLKGSTLDMGALECQTGDFTGFGLHPDEEGIIYIKENGIGDGSSWAHAAGDINLAIATSDFEDVNQIWVAGGIYYPTKSNQRSFSFVLRNRIPLYGGFKGDEKSVQERPRIDSDADGIIEPWEFEYPSILSGNIGDPEDSLDNSHIIIYRLYSDSISIVDGYTITDGYSHESINYTSNSGHFKNCVISNNFYYGPGGGAGNSLLWHCLLKENTAINGGGAWASSLYDCIIEDNYGGGVSDCKLNNCVLASNIGVGASGSDLIGCLVIGNESGRGGGIFNCRADNSYLINNKASIYGGGAYASNLKNCLVGFNTATIGGGGACSSNLLNCMVIRNWAESAGGIYYLNSNEYGGNGTNSILWGNSANPGCPQQIKGSFVTYSSIQGGYDGIGNISLDSINEQGPRFTNPTDSFPGYTSYEELKRILNNDWSLQSSSPCIDMGNNELYDGPETDLAGNRRIICGVIDMGAYENKSSVPEFGINYIEETTNKPILPFVAYNSANEFTGDELYGNGQPIPLYPDTFSKMLYFRVTDSDTTEYSLDSLYIPPRPEDPAAGIDYPAEILTQVAPNTFWNVTGDFAAIHEEESITAYIPEAGNPEDTLTLRIEASDTSFAAFDPQALLLIPRPDTPTAAINYPDEFITGVPPNATWDISGSFTALTEGEPLTNYIPNAGQESISTHIAVQSTDTSFRSRDQVLTIPTRTASPEVGIDYVEESLTGVEDNAHWNMSGIYEPVIDGESVTGYIPGYGYDTDTVNLIFAATHTSFHSDEQALAISARPAPPTNANVNDNDDTFGWDWSQNGYEAAGDYEHSTDNGMLWSVCLINPLMVGNVDLPVGYVHVRVQASNEPEKERFRSEALLSDAPFTVLTALDPEDKNRIQVYPTVTRGIVNCILPDEDECTLQVFNSRGMLILTRENLHSTEVLDLSVYKEGLYILKIGGSQRHEQVFKIIKL